MLWQVIGNDITVSYHRTTVQEQLQSSTKVMYPLNDTVTEMPLLWIRDVHVVFAILGRQCTPKERSLELA